MESNNIEYLELSNWGKNLIISWMDGDYQPSIEMIKQKKWKAIPIADEMLPIEAEWIAEAIEKVGITEIFGLRYQHDEIPEVKKIEINRDAILSYWFENNHENCILTDKDNQFFIYKDDSGEFFIICGQQNFVKDAYKCSYDTAKIMFFYYLVDPDEVIEQGKKYFTNLWKKYESTFE